MSAKKMSETYNKKMTSLKGTTEETGMQRAIRERTHAVIARASAKTQADVVGSLAALKVKTTAALDSISSSLSSEIEVLKEVQEAITAQQANLKNLHGIVAEANSLQALQLAHEDERRQFDEMMVQARRTWEEDKKAGILARSRDDEQYRYDLEKRRRAEDDAVMAQRAQLTAQFNADLAKRSMEVELREKAVAGREAEFKALQEQVAKFDETLKKDTSTAVAIATNSLKKDLTHEHTIKTLEFQNTIKLKETEIVQLNNRIGELVKQVQTLDTEYKAASTKVQQIAEKAIDGASRQQTVVQVPGNESGDSRRK